MRAETSDPSRPASLRCSVLLQEVRNVQVSRTGSSTRWFATSGQWTASLSLALGCCRVDGLWRFVFGGFRSIQRASSLTAASDRRTAAGRGLAWQRLAPSNPAAITVTRTSSPNVSSMTAPKMMFFWVNRFGDKTGQLR